MSKYVAIIIWIGICALLLYMGRLVRKEVVLGELKYRVVPWFAIIVFVPVIWVTANRGYFADTSVYIFNFKNMPESIFGISDYLKTVSKDKGFSLIACLIKIFLTHNIRVYLGILAVLQSSALIVIYRKYSEKYLISVFLFLVSADYISWMFNGIRQFLAVSIIFLATPLMLRRKFVPLLIIIIMAATIHFSALLMIPFVLIAQGKAWNSKTLVFIVLIIASIVFVDKFTTLLDDSLSVTQYTNVVSDYTEWKDTGTNILRVLVYSIPSLFAFFGRRYIEKSDDILVNFCTNMSIITTGMYFVSWATSGIFIGRIPIYTSLYGYVLLPWEIENMFSVRSKRFVYLIMICSYLVFYYYQLHVSWGIM